MRALIGDPSPFNRRFLRAAATRRGFDSFLEVSTTRELVEAARVQQPQLILFDPALDNSEGLDVFEELWLASKNSLLVIVSSDPYALAKARTRGIAAVMKKSVNQMVAVEAAIVVDPVKRRAAVVAVQPAIAEVIRLDDTAVGLPMWRQRMLVG